MNLRQETDERLMAQAAGGDRACLELLVRRHASPLLTFIRRLVGDAHKSEELFQDVFLAVWTKRRQYEYPRPFKSWLYAIAANQCRADYRRRGPIMPVPLEETCAPGLSPAETAVQTETAALIETAVAQLPHQQRVVVVLRVWEGLPYAKIAQIVERTESTVRSHMHHGLAALRKYLEPRLKT